MGMLRTLRGMATASLYQRLKRKTGLVEVVCKGCRVNLRNNQGILMGKGWKIATTNPHIATYMHRPCNCPPGFKHGECQGRDTGNSAYYSKEFVTKACQAILRGEPEGQLMAELGLEREGDGPGKPVKPQTCACEFLESHSELVCGTCLLASPQDNSV